MDWIDEKLLQVKNRLKMQSLKKALSIYLIIAISSVVIVYLVTVVFCEGWRTLIYQKYLVDKNSPVPISSFVNLDSVDLMIITLIDIVQKFSILIYSIITIVITSNIFYKNKIEEPILILKEEAKYISRNDLSFSCCYESGDEMGEICEAFDKMRIQLSKNNETVWSIMESQRQLNAAFAHDLRNPLTVIQGYTELLVKYYPEGKISEEKLLETLELIQSQVNRLKEFSETMKDIHTFDSMETNPKKNNLEIIGRKITEIVNGLKLHHSMEIKIDNKLPVTEAYFNEGIILEVVDNLLSNALSYTMSKVDIILEEEENLLFIYIRDDGKGFSQEDLYLASRPYYTNRLESGNHFGIGLTICKLLCEKHGGELKLTNSTRGGAIVCASFLIM
ncbi:MAG: HAMP domain-containing sensor histidine kinase [Clostridium sp.]|uniref:sensor histidine kinase n=1 Tax=Clostridium sp. TaxID=1506 RepID=UPI003023596E